MTPSEDVWTLMTNGTDHHHHGTARAKTVPPADPELVHAAAVLKLLGERTRLAILAMLHKEPMTVSVLNRRLGRPVPAVSQHLAKLREANLVTATRDGNTIQYAQSDVHLAALVTNALHLAEHTLYETPPHHR